MDADQIDDMPSNINIGPISIFNSNNYGNSITLVNINYSLTFQYQLILSYNMFMLVWTLWNLFEIN